MKKILVPTDFSNNSVAAVRFALQLASQSDFKLTFFHSCNIQRPTAWKDSVYEAFKEKELAEQSASLLKYVNSSFESLGAVPEDLNYEVQCGSIVESTILDYAEKNNFDYICISRKGHGNSIQIFGSITSHLITKSEVPVITVPSSYQQAKIETITYATDLSNLEKELQLVSEFSESLGANLEVLHFKAAGDDLIETPEAGYPVKIHFEPLKYEKTLIENIDGMIKQSNTSMLVMFTKQKRTFFEKLFVSSISAEYASEIDIPLLVFKKP